VEGLTYGLSKHCALGIKGEIGLLKAELKGLQSTLNTLKAAPSSASLNETVALLESEVQQLKHQLIPLRASPAKPVSVEEKAALDAEHASLQRLLRLREKQFKDFWGTICEGCDDINPNDLWVSDHAAPSFVFALPFHVIEIIFLIFLSNVVYFLIYIYIYILF
jgi:hypothetical protein